MTGLEWFLAVAGVAVTVMVVVAMILITPRGVIEAPEGAANPEDADLPRAATPERDPVPPHATSGENHMIVLAIAGVLVTVAVVVAMILFTRKGAERAPQGHANPNDPPDRVSA